MSYLTYLSVWLYDTHNLAQHTHSSHSHWRGEPIGLPWYCSHIHTYTCHWRELCREACRDPNNLNGLVSSLVWAPNSWLRGLEFNRQQLGNLTKSERPGVRPSTLSSVHCAASKKEIKELLAHCKEIWIYVFPEKELRSLRPSFNIHSLRKISVFLRSAHIFSCTRIGRPIRGIYK